MDFGVALTEDDYKHFSVLRSNPNEISDACDICAVSSTNNQKIDEIIYGKQLTNIEYHRLAQRNRTRCFYESTYEILLKIHHGGGKIIL